MKKKTTYNIMRFTQNDQLFCETPQNYDNYLASNAIQNMYFNN